MRGGAAFWFTGGEKADEEGWLPDLYDLDDEDPAQDSAEDVRDAFRTYEPRGQQARMVTLFRTLCAEAGIISVAANGSAAVPRRRQIRRVQPRQTTPRSRSAERRQGVEGLPVELAGLLNGLPPSRRWTQQRRDDFVKTFEAVLDFCIKIGEEETYQIKGE